MFLARFSHVVIVHNNVIRAKFLERVAGRFADRVVVIPHGVDVLPQREGVVGGGKVNVLFTGFVRESKGIEDFLRAVSLLGDDVKDRIHVLVAGSPHVGDDISYIRKIVSLVKRLNLEKIVRLDIRFIPEDELSGILASADIIVLPYKDFFYEASGVLARAIGAGKPIICTRIPKFLSELKDGEEAVFVPVGDVKALSRAISLLVSNGDLRRRLGEAVRRKGLRRSWRRVAIQHVKIYLRLIRGKK